MQTPQDLTVTRRRIEHMPAALDPGLCKKVGKQLKRLLHRTGQGMICVLEGAYDPTANTIESFERVTPELRELLDALAELDRYQGSSFIVKAILYAPRERGHVHPDKGKDVRYVADLIGPGALIDLGYSTHGNISPKGDPISHDLLPTDVMRIDNSSDVFSERPWHQVLNGSQTRVSLTYKRLVD